MFPRLYVFCSVAGVAACTIPANAGSAVLISERDNTLYQSTTGSLSNGAGDHFFAGRTGLSELRRGLVWFDVAAEIPELSKIDNVTLMLHMSRSISGASDVSIHTVLSDWGEGTSDASGQEGGGASPTLDDATWLHTFHSSSFWINPGGDFMPTASASTSVAGVGFYTWGSTTQMVMDVQSWLDNPSGNFGWLLQGNESFDGTTKRFDTHENPTESFRPMLIINYTPIPGPAVLCIFLAGGLIGIRRSRRRNAG